MKATELDSMNRLRVEAERTNRELRAALRWLLWHHQGACSVIGLACRHALGMGRFDRLTDAQIADAKEWQAEWEAATTKQEEGETLPGILCPNGGYCDYPSNPCFTCRRPRPSNPSGDGSQR